MFVLRCEFGHTIFPEYAKSGRSKCASTVCKGLIAKGEIRFGKAYDTGERQGMGWKHIFCVTSAAIRKAGSTDMNGFAELNEEDQDLVRRVISRDAEALKEAKEKSAALLLLQSAPAKRAAKAPKLKAAEPVEDHAAKKARVA